MQYMQYFRDIAHGSATPHAFFQSPQTNVDQAGLHTPLVCHQTKAKTQYLAMLRSNSKGTPGNLQTSLRGGTRVLSIVREIIQNKTNQVISLLPTRQYLCTQIGRIHVRRYVASQTLTHCHSFPHSMVADGV